MRFTLVDRIIHLEPRSKITVIKSLSLAEEYLADHFPRFPVMPGVLMLEAMTQAGAWLIRVTDDFEHSLVTLKQARNVRFKNFVAPGQLLTITAEIVDHGERETQLNVQGCVDQCTAVTGSLVLVRANLADEHPERASTDDLIRRKLQDLLALLYRAPEPSYVQQNGTAPAAGIKV